LRRLLHEDRIGEPALKAAFQTAAGRGDADAIHLILRERPDAIGAADIDRAMQQAGSVGVARALLATGRASDGSVSAALLHAVGKADLATVRLVLDHAPAIDCRGALSMALAFGMADAALMLLGRACSDIPPFYWGHPRRHELLEDVVGLHRAIREGDADTVRGLALSAARDSDVRLGAQYAAAIGSAPMLQLILDTRFDTADRRLPADAVHPQGDEARAVWRTYVAWSPARVAWIEAVMTALPSARYPGATAGRPAAVDDA
jgi:hypothetical protein